MEPFLPHSPELIAGRISDAGRSVLLFGESGIGKSILADFLARELAKAGRSCLCIGADPGSPSFGAPGAVCLGRWKNDSWKLIRLEALCTLDSGRFRLPLLLAVQRLARGLEGSTLLIDAPGVVRNVAGAEFIAGLTEAVKIDTVLVLAHHEKKLPLANELTTLDCEVLFIEPSTKARLLSKRKRALYRTRLWDEYLHQAVTRTIPVSEALLTGTPPPLEMEKAWVGRQIALLNKGATLGIGEILSINRNTFQLRMAGSEEPHDQVLVRDAQRNERGLLGTSKPVGSLTMRNIPPPDIAPYPGPEKTTGPRPMVRFGDATGILVNGVFGDPLLHLRFHNSKRSILFDIGEGSRLPARLAHQVSDVFVSHAHFDHICGFLWLLRSRIGVQHSCSLFGPPGLSDHILNMINGIHWDRIGESGPRFEVGELHDNHLLIFRLQAGHAEKKQIENRRIPDGLLLQDPDCKVRGVILQHGSIPVVAYSLELASKFNVRKESLLQHKFSPGPWLDKLKKHLARDDRQASILLPDGTTENAGILADEFIEVTPPQKLVYATDLSDTKINREKLITLARGAHTFFCEAGFMEKDRQFAELSGHLTTFGCSEIARASGANQLVPFHFSRRYEDTLENMYTELKEQSTQVNQTFMKENS